MPSAAGEWLQRALSVPLSVLFLFASSHAAHANPDIYSALPEDIQVIKYVLGDADGDGTDEIGILYRTGNRVNLTFFHTADGKWKRWWDYSTGSDSSNLRLHSFDIRDVTGNGRNEVIVNLISPGSDLMASKVLVYDRVADSPSFSVLLEDSTRPAGYPLFGDLNGKSSVTFLDLGDENRSGHRRVYCWQGRAFEKCLEVPWGLANKNGPKPQDP